jgi:hypothetical protein
MNDFCIFELIHKQRHSPKLVHLLPQVGVVEEYPTNYRVLYSEGPEMETGHKSNSNFSIAALASK